MKIKPVNKNMIDIFLEPEKQHATGFDPSLWIRLQLRAKVWIQIAGIKIPSWKYKQIIETIPK